MSENIDIQDREAKEAAEKAAEFLRRQKHDDE